MGTDMRSLASLLIALGIACLPCRGQAGDVFGTNSNEADGTACQKARNAEDARYSANIKAIQDRYNAGETQPGPPNLERLRQYARERGNEDTRHAKAMVALDAGVCSYLRQTGNTPCDQATYQEDKNYEKNMSVLEQRKLDEDNQADQQRMACASDANCVARVDQQALKTLQAWAAARSQEMERHSNALAKIRVGICSPQANGGALQGTVEQSGNSSRPNPPSQTRPSQTPPTIPGSANQSSPCYTPARGADCPPVRFGWGNCPGSGLACVVCYGPDGVFAYVPRGSVYTLESGCKQFPNGTIWSTKNAQTAQQMTQAGGYCTPDGRGGYNCGNVDPQRFKQVVNAQANGSSSTNNSQDPNGNPQDSSCYTPARAASCSPVRFGWGNCPGSKQACDICYGPNGPFAYVPRGSVYSLQSGCSQIGGNATWRTISSLVEQQMVKAGGNCNPDGQGGYLCANVDPQRFKQATGQK